MSKSLKMNKNVLFESFNFEFDNFHQCFMYFLHCVSLDETGLSVRNVAIRVGNTEFSQVCGYAWQYEMDKNPGKLLVEFHPGSPPGTYWILGTDYDNYACVYR